MAETKLAKPKVNLEKERGWRVIMVLLLSDEAITISPLGVRAKVLSSPS